MAAILALCVAGCSAEDIGDPCPLSEAIEAACQEEQDTTTYTCVVAEHPSCNEQVCAAWGSAEPFCSRTCETDAECPGSYTCEDYLTFGVCVSEEALAPAEDEDGDEE